MKSTIAPFLTVFAALQYILVTFANETSHLRTAPLESRIAEYSRKIDFSKKVKRENFNLESDSTYSYDKSGYAALYYTNNGFCKLGKESYVSEAFPLGQCLQVNSAEFSSMNVFVEKTDKDFAVKIAIFADNNCLQASYLYDFDYTYGNQCSAGIRYKVDQNDGNYGVVLNEFLSDTCPATVRDDQVFHTVNVAPLNTCVPVNDKSSLLMTDCEEAADGYIYAVYNRYNNLKCSGKPNSSKKRSKLFKARDCTEGGLLHSFYTCRKPSK